MCWHLPEFYEVPPTGPGDANAENIPGIQMGLLWRARAENSWMKIVKDEIKEARYGQIGKLRPFFSPVGKYLDSLLCKAGSHSFCLFVFVFVFSLRQYVTSVL